MGEISDFRKGLGGHVPIPPLGTETKKFKRTVISTGSTIPTVLGRFAGVDFGIGIRLLATFKLIVATGINS